MQVHALGAYTDPLMKFIRAKNGGTPVGIRQLAELITVSGMLNNLEYDYIVPVPVHWSKLIYRGFNQAEEMARYLSRVTGKPYLNVMLKNRKTADQASLGKKQRLTNLRNVFEQNKNYSAADLAGKKLLIVDDVMTTGATLVSCAEALLEFKPALITALVGARVP